MLTTRAGRDRLTDGTTAVAMAGEGWLLSLAVGVEGQQSAHSRPRSNYGSRLVRVVRDLRPVRLLGSAAVIRLA